MGIRLQDQNKEFVMIIESYKVKFCLTIAWRVSIIIPVFYSDEQRVRLYKVKNEQEENYTYILFENKPLSQISKKTATTLSHTCDQPLKMRN